MAGITVKKYTEGNTLNLTNGSFSRIILSSAQVNGGTVTGGYSVFKPGTITKQMVHEVEEIAYVVSGKGNIIGGQETFHFEEGDFIYIPAKVPHGIENQFDQDLVMVFFFPSAGYPKTFTVDQ